MGESLTDGLPDWPGLPLLPMGDCLLELENKRFRHLIGDEVRDGKFFQISQKPAKSY